MHIKKTSQPSPFLLARRTLRAGGAHSTLLLESVSSGIWELDCEGRVTFVNLAAARMLGYTAEELTGEQMHAVIHHSYPDGTPYPCDQCPMHATLADGKSRVCIDEVLWRKDGSSFAVEYSTYPLISSGNTIGAVVVFQDITGRRKAEEQVSRSRRLLEALSDAQTRFITGYEHQETFEHLLKILLDYSGSEYGFIGEVFHDAQGMPYLKEHAISNIAWNEATRMLFDKHAEQGLEFRNLNTLFGAVMTTGKPVIANDPAHDPRAAGLPPGHPAMNSFLGLPLYKGQEMIGMLGVANRAGGYDEQVCDELAPLAATCASLIESWRENLRRRLAEEALQQSNRRFEAVLQAVPDLMFELDRNGRYLNVWGVRGDLLAAPASELVGHTVLDILPAQAAAEVLAAIAEADEKTHSFGRQIQLSLPQGQTWFELSVAKQSIRPTQATSFVVLSRDITARRQNEEALQLAASVYQFSHEAILVTDERNFIIDVNPAFTLLTGYTLDEVKGSNPSMFSSGRHDQSFYQQMWQSIQDEGYWQGEIWDKRRDGELHAKWLSISVIRHPDGSVFRYVAQFSDITGKKRQDELIWTQANFDALTRLPNRFLLADRMYRSVAACVRSGLHGALLSLDLDHFKQLNDTFGHSMGDKLLIEVARRMQGCVREEDTVARMGGDEFIVVLNELSTDEKAAAVQAELVAEKIRDALCRPYFLDGIEYHTSASIGIVLFCEHSDSQEVLLAHVDSAMYQAKAKGRNTICFFDTFMQVALAQRSHLDSALRVAQERREFMLYYQLQIDGAGRAIGAEALLRWQHPKLGMVSPAQFIPVAEENGTILPIGLWVLETACAQLALWQVDPHLCHLSIAVNVSSRQFREPDFVAHVCKVLEKTAIRPHLLKLELTESIVLDNVEESIVKMNALKTLGLKFSMDDFGTGYSSLSYLSRLPMDQLKIDQSFVRDITTDKNDAAIVHTIISMAQGLGLEVIAEGVETQAQRDFLEYRGCLTYQGYLYARPLPVDQLEQKLLDMR